MKSRRWFIEKVEGVAALGALKFAGQLDALSFAATQLCGGLAEAEVTQPDLLKGIEAPRYRRNVAKKDCGLVDGHRQDVGNVLTPVGNRKGVGVVPRAVTGRTRRIGSR